MTSAAPRIDSAGVRIVTVSALCIGVGASLGFLSGFLATALRDDLDISRGEVGLLVSVYFGCTGIGSILGGRATEAFGARIVITVDMVLVAIAAFLSAAIGEYWALLLAGVIGGSGYALVNAGTNVAIGRAVPPERRTLAMSIKTAGVPLMAVLAAGIGPGAASRSSWEAVLGVTGVIAAVAAAVAFFTFADDRPAKVERSKAELPDGFIWFAFGAFLVIAGSQPLYSWIVAYLEESLDTSAGLAGAVSAGASGCGVVFMVSTSLRTDRVGPEARIRRMMVLVSINATGTVMVLAGEAIGVGFVALGAVIGISAQLAAIGTMHAAVVDRAPEAVARATGVTMTGYYIGALASPAMFGWLTDVTGTFAWSWAATAVLLAAAVPVWAVAGRGGLNGRATPLTQTPTTTGQI